MSPRFSNLDGPTIFTQCMSMADVDNDGRVDVFACNDVGPSNIWITECQRRARVQCQRHALEPPLRFGPVPASDDMSGNYGSVLHAISTTMATSTCTSATAARA